MLSALFRLFVRKAMKGARPLRCPACRVRLVPEIPAGEREPWTLTQHCGECGWAGSWQNLVQARQGLPEAAEEGAQSSAGVDAAGQRGFSEEARADETAEFVIPASKNSRGLMFFAVFWNLLSWTVAPVIIFSGAGGYPIVLAAAVFPLIGAGLMYAALRMKYAKHRVLITPDRVVLERTLFRSVKRMSLARQTLTSVMLNEFYSRNYQPVYGIEIRGTGGKLRFGTSMEEVDKEALCAALQERLKVKEAGGGTTAEGDGGAYEGGALAVDESHGRVSVHSGPEKMRGAIIFAVCWLIFCTAGAGLWLKFNFATDLFGLFFLLPPLFFSLIFTAAGIAMLTYFLYLRGRTTTVEADAGGLHYQAGKPGRMRTVQLRPDEVLRIGTVITSRINGRPRWRGEIITADRVYPFGEGSPPDTLRQSAAAMERVMGRIPQEITGL